MSQDKKELTLDEMVESLYNLDRWELRRLAAEALLISDGPDSALLHEDPGTAVLVDRHEVLERLGHVGFILVPHETSYKCMNCDETNILAFGTDPGDYRCRNCVEWL